MSDSAKVFPYQDGAGKQLYGDPTALLRRLHCYCHGDYNELLDQCEAKEPEAAFAANARLAKAVCQTFCLGQPWNEETGDGVLESHWRAVLTRFLDHPDVATAAPPAEGERADATPIPVEGA